MTSRPREQISPYQMVALLFFVRLVPRTLVCPTTMTAPPVEDLPLADAVSSLAALGFVAAVCRLGERHPDQSIIQYAGDLLGRPVGKLVGLILCAYFFFVAAYTARMLGEAFNMTLMPHTPRVVFIASLTLLAANAARAGLEVVARSGEFLLPVILLVLLLLLILPLDQVDPIRLGPLLRHGPEPVLPAVTIEFMFYLEFILLGMLIPHLRVPHKAARFALLFTATNGVLMTGMCLVMVGVFGPTLDSLGLQAFLLARMIRAGEFLERVEAILLASWVLSTGVKLSVFLWALCAGLRQTFDLRTCRHLAYPFAALVIAGSILLFEDAVHLSRLLAEPWTVVNVVFVLGLTTVLGAAQLLRGGGDR